MPCGERGGGRGRGERGRGGRGPRRGERAGRIEVRGEPSNAARRGARRARSSASAGRDGTAGWGETGRDAGVAEQQRDGGGALPCPARARPRQNIIRPAQQPSQPQPDQYPSRAASLRVAQRRRVA